MKGKVLSIITAVLFGATMVAAPVIMAAGMDSLAGMEEQQAPAKKSTAKKTTKKKSKKSTAKKTTKKKHAKKKKEAAPAMEEK